MKTKTQALVKPEVSDSDVPTFIFVSSEYALATTNWTAPNSPRIIEIPFNDFAENYEMQATLKLGSIVFIHPHFHPPLCYPLEGEELRKSVAGFLSAFYEDPQERQQIRHYLTNNGLLRILLTDKKLNQDMHDLIVKQDHERVQKRLEKYENSPFYSANESNRDFVGVDFATNNPKFKYRTIY